MYARLETVAGGVESVSLIIPTRRPRPLTLLAALPRREGLRLAPPPGLDVYPCKHNPFRPEHWSRSHPWNTMFP